MTIPLVELELLDWPEGIGVGYPLTVVWTLSRRACTKNPVCTKLVSRAPRPRAYDPTPEHAAKGKAS
jgi:hypothetical protein